jgi:hypothetical protein
MKPLFLEAKIKETRINNLGTKDLLNLQHIRANSYAKAKEMRDRCPDDMWKNYKTLFDDVEFPEQKMLNDLYKAMKYEFNTLFKRRKTRSSDGSDEGTGRNGNNNEGIN